MRRLALIVALGAVAVSLMAASVAWGADTIQPMCTTAQGTQLCNGAWYTEPVAVVWQANPPPTSTSGCELGIEYAYNADTTSSLSCTASWADGTQSSYQVPLHVETSSPTATAIPSRPADSSGWYSAPVSFSFSGSSFSGIASCTSTTYAGPNTTSATVSGTCTDNAGKTVAVTSTPFAYEATPPTLTATATPGDQSATLNWQTSGDLAPIASISVSRTPSAGIAEPAVVYSGDAAGFHDSHLRNGVHYTYTISARDQAGNVATQAVGVTPGARLLSPAANARLTAPPMLSWTPVPGASYYNVQLYRGDPRKVLSLWPATAGLQLKHTWRFDGRRYRLKPGKYKWFVWPGFGRRKAGRYGHMIGSGTFVVVR